MELGGNRKLLDQIIKFGFVGGTAFLIDYMVLYLLTEFLGLHYLVAGTISFALSVIYNYILSILGLAINQAIMWLTVEKFDIYYMFSKIFATVVVMIFNFVTRKIFLEK